MAGECTQGGEDRWPLTAKIVATRPGHIHVGDSGPTVPFGREPGAAWCRLCGLPICRSLDPGGRFNCTKTAGHEGEHENEWGGGKWGGGA